MAHAVQQLARARPPRAALGAALAVGSLAGAAAVVAARARRAERQHPPTGRFTDVDGLRIHSIEAGAGPGVVLLHGNGAMASDFVLSGLFGLLARHHRVLAFDRPGFGHTRRPGRFAWTARAQAHLLRQAWMTARLERPVLVSHSWGNLVALEAALAFPSEIAGLVLVSGYYFPTARADAPLSLPPAIPLVGDVMRYTVSPLLARLLAPRLYRKLFAPRPVPREFADGFPLSLALRPSQLRASAEEAALMIPSAAKLEARYGEVTAPTAILAGTEDQIVDAHRQSTRLAGAIAGSELRLISATGHMAHYAAAGEVLQAVERVAR